MEAPPNICTPAHLARMPLLTMKTLNPVCTSRYLVDAPPNICTPAHLELMTSRVSKPLKSLKP